MKCGQCRFDKPDTEFVTLRGKPRKHCAKCAEELSAYGKANIDRVREYKRQWYENNRERMEARASARRKDNKEQIRRNGRKWYELNREKTKQQSRDWREQHHEQYLANNRSYYQANRSKIMAANRLYNETHKDQLADARRALSAKHPGRDVQRVRAWRKANPIAASAMMRNLKARRRKAEGKHTASDIEWLFRQQGGRCEACRKKLITKGKGKYHVDHMKPVVLGGCNDIENLQLLCPSCNTRKNAMSYEEWCSKLGRLPFIVSKAS